jgi:hypothetical protein
MHAWGRGGAQLQCQSGLGSHPHPSSTRPSSKQQDPGQQCSHGCSSAGAHQRGAGGSTGSLASTHKTRVSIHRGWHSAHPTGTHQHHSPLPINKRTRLFTSTPCCMGKPCLSLPPEMLQPAHTTVQTGRRTRELHTYSPEHVALELIAQDLAIYLLGDALVVEVSAAWQKHKHQRLHAHEHRAIQKQT